MIWSCGSSTPSRGNEGSSDAILKHEETMKRTILLVLMTAIFAWAGIGCKKNTSGIVIKNFEETDIPKGDVVLVNFWATWCEPCKIEIPELIELQQKYSSHGFTVIG